MLRYLLALLGGLVIGVILFGIVRELMREPPPVEILVEAPVMLESSPAASVAPATPPATAEHPPGVDLEPEGVVREDAARRLPQSEVGTSDGERQADGPDGTCAAGSPSGSEVAVVSVAMPRYPADARREGVSGEVALAFTVNADGSVTDLEVVRAEPPDRFEQAAKRAILRSKYRPRMVNGVPVATRVQQIVRFGLADE
ncbi:MAG TPA: TonB family protein [Gammaproteobacteria bacterium]|nr:TonB family protein [Gammaproteobacteria bacterium]